MRLSVHLSTVYLFPSACPQTPPDGPLTLRLSLRPFQLALGPLMLSLRTLWTDGQTDGQTDRISLPCYYLRLRNFSLEESARRKGVNHKYAVNFLADAFPSPNASEKNIIL